jgi:hypothetical protein
MNESSIPPQEAMLCLRELPSCRPSCRPRLGKVAEALFRRPGHIAELPPFLGSLSFEHELLRLRNRLASVEEQLLFGGAYRSGIGGPAELPEGGDEFGSGGSVFRRPGHINELPPYDLLASISEQLVTLTERVASLEEVVKSSSA